jgi:upstream activation factor subunit UAF30
MELINETSSETASLALSIEISKMETDLKGEFDEICDELLNIKTSVNSLMLKLRQYKKRVDKILKDNSIDNTSNEKPPKSIKTQEPKETKEPKEPKEKKPRKKKEVEIQSAILKSASLSKELCEFLGKSEDTEMLRTEVTKEIYKYIQDNNLQDSENKKLINPNDQLIKLFNLEEKQELTYFNIQTFLNKHFI